MQIFYAAAFMLLMEKIGMSHGQLYWRQRPMPKDHDVYPDYLTEAYDRSLADFEQNCIHLELIGPLATIRKLRDVLAKPEPTQTLTVPLEIELSGRLFDELVDRSFFSLSLAESERYKNPRKGWETIIEQFPDIVGDLEEAQKCFALSRYAAAVFHSLQVVEFGLIELGKLLNVRDPMPGWASTTAALARVMKTKYPERTPFEQQNGVLLEQMHATVESLKNAWRNKVSHAHGKLTLLTSDFSPDIAEEILFATRAFMRRLATLPLAAAGLSPMAAP